MIGIAGGPEKCAWVVDECRIDACIDYKNEDVAARLHELCPDGIDVYFENVGGEILDTVLPLMNLRGRIPVCGLISAYNATEAALNTTGLLFKFYRDRFGSMPAFCNRSRGVVAFACCIIASSTRPAASASAWAWWWLKSWPMCSVSVARL